MRGEEGAVVIIWRVWGCKIECITVIRFSPPTTQTKSFSKIIKNSGGRKPEFDISGLLLT